LVIGLLSILSQLMHCAFLQIWGSLSDRFSNKSIMGVCCPLFLVSIFAWTFTVIPDQRLFSLPLLVAIHLLSGIAGAGITLASSNIALKLAPSGQATAFLAGNAMMNSLAAGIAPVIGGIIADVFADRQLMWTLTWTSSAGSTSFETLHLEHWGFLFFFASVIGVYALYHLRSVAESGEAPREVVVKEFVTCMRQRVRDRTSLRRIWSRVASTLCLLQNTDPRRRKSE
jgi:MFS family permease